VTSFKRRPPICRRKGSLFPVYTRLGRHRAVRTYEKEISTIAENQNFIFSIFVDFVLSWSITSNTDTLLPSKTTARPATNLVTMVTMKVLSVAQDPCFLDIYAEYIKKITTSEVIKYSHAVMVAKITLAALI
jgi:hypothetical protein